jgi:hypothetical protein
MMLIARKAVHQVITAAVPSSIIVVTPLFEARAHVWQIVGDWQETNRALWQRTGVVAELSHNCHWVVGVSREESF